jgi:hypothetical protein
MVKALGYLISAIGIIVLALSFEQIRTLLKIPIPAGITDIILLVAGGIIVVIGIVFISKSPRQKGKEVPIYKGKKIVGYRRD